MVTNPPGSWADFGFARPPDDAPPGMILAPNTGHVLVRPYDTYRAGELLIRDEPTDRYILDAAHVPVLEAGSAPSVGDTLFYVGEVRDDDSSNLWSPTRVVWVSEEIDGQVTVHTLSDSDAVDIYIQEGYVPLRMLSDDERGVVTDLALSLASATVEQSRVLLGVFGCEWLIR